MIEVIRNFRRRNRDRINFEAKTKVKDHGQFVSVVHDNGEVETIDWDELNEVQIRTNDTGPWGADFWWWLIGDRDRLRFPQGATGESTVVAKIEALPGFSEAALGKAVRCTDNQTFSCWRRGGAA